MSSMSTGSGGGSKGSSGGSGGSSGSTAAKNQGQSLFHDEHSQAEVIDTADVIDEVDIDLNSVDSSGEQKLSDDAVPTYVLSDTDSDKRRSATMNLPDRQGYIDDAIVESVINSAVRKEQKRKFIKICSMISFSTFLVIVFCIGLSSSNRHEVDTNVVKPDGTGYRYDDREDPFKPKGSGDDTYMNKQNPTEGSVIPVALRQNLVDVKSKSFDKKAEVPFFFQVPNCGNVVQGILTGCLKLVLATNIPESSQSNEDDKLDIVMHRGHPYVNVDLSYPPGIDRAGNLGLVSSGLADVLCTYHLNYASVHLFNQDVQGRLFVLVRHPVDRSIADYYSLISETDDPVVANMTLDDYTKSSIQESNWLVRFLTNHRQSQLGREHLELAKEILRTKSVVGIYDELKESMRLFEKYFKWNHIIDKGPFTRQGYEVCENEIIRIENSRGKEAHDKTQDIMNSQGDTIYYRLIESNAFDVELYWYAKQLFKEQQTWIESSSRKIHD